MRKTIKTMADTIEEIMTKTNGDMVLSYYNYEIIVKTLIKHNYTVNISYFRLDNNEYVKISYFMCK